MTSARQDFDNPWKDILEANFEDFMAFFFPDIHVDIDWERGYEWLNTELQKIVRDAEVGKRWADKLVKVWRKNGEEAWIVIHIEVQGQPEGGFSERMCVYNYRLRDRYHCPVVSLAILSDERSSWRPHRYDAELWGCRLSFEFPTVKLLDYRHRWEALEASQNPFAIVVMAHLKAQATRTDTDERKRWKFSLTRSLYERGYSRQDIFNLYRFIDWVLTLPDDLELEFRTELTAWEQQQNMPYLSTIERLAKQEGRQEGERSLILRQLSRRVGALSPARAAQIESLSLAQLDLLGEALLDFRSTDDLTEWLQAQDRAQTPG
ncbi:MAG: DUF4351 domain-containing protein [Cyanobacteria bacterium J06639_1]